LDPIFIVHGHLNVKLPAHRAVLPGKEWFRNKAGLRVALAVIGIRYSREERPARPVQKATD
jgi:hypothetical protein